MGETIKDMGVLKSKRLATDELEIRKIRIEGALAGLMAKVQTGQLSVETYAQMVTNKIREEKELSQRLKKEGKLKQAELALRRAKIMEDELNEAEEE